VKERTAIPLQSVGIFSFVIEVLLRQLALPQFLGLS
jgi:hypothetical protein